MPNRILTGAWRLTLLHLGSTIQEAIQCLENSSLQIVLVVAEGNKLVGTLTDGDIRRAFLKGLNLRDAIDGIIRKNPFVAPLGMSKDVVLQLMKSNEIRHLPVTNTAGEVVGLHLWETINEPVKLENPIVIMAGGKGTRLLPHTENCPKPMLEVCGKPMLQRIIERAKSDGFYKFLISVNYLAQVIEDYFKDGGALDVQIEYIREEVPLGTAGCLSLLKQRPDKPFVVTNGDVLTDIHYNEILDYHIGYNATATMAVRQHEVQNQFGVVRLNGIDIEGFEEKPIYRSNINAGIYALNPAALDCLEKQQHCDMPTLFQRIMESAGRTIVYPIHETWLDVGRPEDLERANFSK